MGEREQQELAAYMKATVQGIVDNPEAVDVAAIMGEQTCVLNLRVAPTDVGKVIGKQGKMANALRTLLVAISTKHGMRAVLEILD